jgi:hypothetical protein
MISKRNLCDAHGFETYLKSSFGLDIMEILVLNSKILNSFHQFFLVSWAFLERLALLAKSQTDLILTSSRFGRSLQSRIVASANPKEDFALNLWLE